MSTGSIILLPRTIRHRARDTGHIETPCWRHRVLFRAYTDDFEEMSILRIREEGKGREEGEEGRGGGIR